jgi:glucokinase
VLSELAGTDVKEIRSGDIAIAIKRGDAAIEKLVRSRASMLGGALSNLVDFINPDVIVLGGGWSRRYPRSCARRSTRRSTRIARSARCRNVKVVVAKLHNHAGTTGAPRALPWKCSRRKPPLEL